MPQTKDIEYLSEHLALAGCTDEGGYMEQVRAGPYDNACALQAGAYSASGPVETAQG